MLHFLPTNLKKFSFVQLIMFLNFAIQGLILTPFMFISYLIFYKSNKKLYKYLINKLCFLLWTQFTYIVQWWNRLRLTVYTDPQTWEKFSKEHSVVIMNHKYDIDWLATWIVTENRGNLGGGLSVAKHSLRYVPIMGWAGIFNGSLYLHRNWAKDQPIIEERLSDFHENYDGMTNTLLLYPEGTRYTVAKRDTSNEYAKKYKRQELKHCLIPRTKGFVEIIHQLRGKIPAIYDFTIGFPDSVEDGRVDKQPPFTLNNVLKCKVKSGNMHIRRIPIDDLPTDEKELEEWMHQTYRDKDAMFDEFTKTGKFPGEHSFTISPSIVGPIIYSVSFLLVWVPLCRWVCCLVLFGSWTYSLVLLGFFLLFAVLMHFMKNMTKTEKGSAYGSKSKKTQ